MKYEVSSAYKSVKNWINRGIFSKLKCSTIMMKIFKKPLEKFHWKLSVKINMFLTLQSLNLPVAVTFQLFNLQVWHLLWAKSYLTFRQLQSLDSLQNVYVIWYEHIVKYRLVLKTQFNHLASLAKLLSVRFQTKWL